jgi:hypothetical protein
MSVPTRDRACSPSISTGQAPAAPKTKPDRPNAEQRLAYFTERYLLPVIEAACAQHYCTVAEFMSGDKESHVAAARLDFALHLLAAEWSLKSIGKALRCDYRHLKGLAERRQASERGRRRK